MPSIFSVVMPLYNHAEFVSSAIVSVLNQSMPDFELIVCDDGSTDGSLEVVKGFRDSRIKVISKSNGGVPSALNACLSVSTGNYITWLSSDDYYDADNLSEHLKTHSSQHLISVTNPGIVESEGNTKAYDWSLRPNSNERLLYFFVSHNYINGLTVSFHRSLLQSTGLFSERFRYAHDEDYWMRLFHQIAPKFSESNKLHTFTRVGSGNFNGDKAGLSFDPYFVHYSRLKDYGIRGLAPREYSVNGLGLEFVRYCLSIIKTSQFRLRRFLLFDQVALMLASELNSRGFFNGEVMQFFIDEIQTEIEKLPPGSIKSRHILVQTQILKHDFRSTVPIKFSEHLLAYLNDFQPMHLTEAESYLSWITD
jgi:teichuronic acid biosynthesis glycosyltransferase TuaG